MTNLTDYPYPSYDSNQPAAAVLASLIGISLIAWFVQLIRSHFQPRRINVLLLLGHMTIFVELVLRAVLSTAQRNSKNAYTATTVLLAVGQRMIILANYDFLVRAGDLKPCATRSIVIGTVVVAVGSAIIMAPAGTLSYSPDTIPQSFRLRQASAAIVLCLTVLFYPVWFATKTGKLMTKKGIILLVISSITSLIVAIFLIITSIPDYYTGANEQELWYYIFQLTPIAIALFTWTILHPKRSLVSEKERREKENIKQDIDISL